MPPDLTEAFRLRANYAHSLAARQYTPGGVATFINAMAPIVEERMTERRMALAAAWDFQKKADLARQMGEQLGYPVMPGESPAAAMKRNAPPDPEVPEDLVNLYDAVEDAADRARAASGAGDRNAYDKAAGDHEAGMAAFRKAAEPFTPEQMKFFNKFLNPTASAGRRGGKGIAKPPKAPTPDKEQDDRDWLGKWGATALSEPDKLPPEALSSIPPSLAATIAARISGAKRMAFGREKWLASLRNIDADNARADDAAKRGDVALAARLNKDAYDAARKAVNDFEEEAGMRRKKTSIVNGEYVDRYELDLSVLNTQEERDTYKALIQKRDALQKKVGVAPTNPLKDPKVVEPPVPQVDRMRELLKKGDQRTPEEDAEFLRLTE